MLTQIIHLMDGDRGKFVGCQDERLTQLGLGFAYKDGKIQLAAKIDSDITNWFNPPLSFNLTDEVQVSVPDDEPITIRFLTGVDENGNLLSRHCEFGGMPCRIQ